MAKRTTRIYEEDQYTMETTLSEESVIETDEKNEEFNTHTEESPAEMETNGPETIINGTTIGTIIKSFNVNVRAEPSITAAVVGQFRRGDRVMILGTDNGFCKIKFFGNKTAYILSDFVKEEQNG